MTDEERQKLVARFKAHEVVMWTDIDLAADEIERLAKEIKYLHTEIERMEKELEKAIGNSWRVND